MRSKKGLKEAVGAELLSVVENLPQETKEKLRKVSDQISEKAEIAFANVDTLNTFLNRVKDQISPKEKSLLDLFMYLILIEGPFDLTMDVILVALIFAGHDLYITRNQKYASTSFEDLENVDLWMKQSFLENHGFPYVSNAIDRRLRNKIAHHDFQIDDNGRIRIDGEFIDIHKKIQSIFEAGRILAHIYDMVIGKVSK